jgi:uncharacterized protein (PEP-CTERM system associated)
MERLTFLLGYRYRTNDYNTPRDDTTNTVNLKVDYLLLSWLTAGAGYEYKDRESTVRAYDYDQNRWRVSLKAGF